MASPIDVARRRAVALEAELKQIQTFIQMYEAFSTESETKLEQTALAANAQVSSEPIHNKESYRKAAAFVAARRGRRSGPTPKDIVEMVERMIRDAGRPLTRGEITSMFEARDVEIPATDKARYVGTIMWRNKSKFLNIEGRGYWLRGEPVLRTQNDKQPVL